MRVPSVPCRPFPQGMTPQALWRQKKKEGKEEKGNGKPASRAQPRGEGGG